jgi:hypothetical protein
MIFSVLAIVIATLVSNLEYSCVIWQKFGVN